MTARKRKPEESYEKYRQRLKDEAYIEKDMRKGRLIWSSLRGPYEKPKSP